MTNQTIANIFEQKPVARSRRARAAFRVVSRAALLVGIVSCTIEPPPPTSGTSSAGTEAMHDPEASETAGTGNRPLRLAGRAEDLAALPVRWPAAWRLLESGRFGPESDDVVWFRLEAPATAADDAARAALHALEAVAGKLSFSHVAAVPDDPSRAVAQLRGAHLIASIDARTDDQVTSLLITVERKGGR